MEHTKIVIQASPWVEDILKTFIGAAAAFLFGIILFAIQQFMQGRRRRETLKRNVLKEIEYDLYFLNSAREEATKQLQRIGTNAQTIYVDIRFEDLLRKFLLEAYEDGLTFEHFTPKEIARQNDMLSSFGSSLTTLLNQKVAAYNAAEAGSKEDMIQFLEWIIESKISPANDLLETMLDRMGSET